MIIYKSCRETARSSLKIKQLNKANKPDDRETLSEATDSADQDNSNSFFGNGNNASK